MVLKLSGVGFLSMLFLPIFFLLTIRIMGNSNDPLAILVRLSIAQALSFAFSFVLMLYLNNKAKNPLPQTMQ